MNPKIKQLWIDALRSGQYKQGRECLHSGDKYCCLGVLTDIYAKQTGETWSQESPYYFLFEGEAGILPCTVQEWAGLNYPDPIVFGRSLSKWNDDGTSFEEIAGFIEKGL